jgi:hypothetical protein
MGEFPNKSTQFSSSNQPEKNGRKPKSFKMFNDMMKERGFEPITKAQLIEAYSFIFSANEETIQEIADDESQPLALRLIIAEMTNEISRGKALADYRDYMFGKAGENLTVKTEQPIFKGIELDVS